MGDRWARTVPVSSAAATNPQHTARRVPLALTLMATVRSTHVPVDPDTFPMPPSPILAVTE